MGKRGRKTGESPLALDSEDPGLDVSESVGVESDSDADVDASAPLPPEMPVEVVAVATPPLMVTVGNLTGLSLHLSTVAGLVRLPPKASVVLAESDLTEATRQAAVDGRIVIHPCKQETAAQ